MTYKAVSKKGKGNALGKKVSGIAKKHGGSKRFGKSVSRTAKRKRNTPERTQ